MRSAIEMRASLCFSANAVDLRPAHHGAVVVHQFGQHADRRQLGEPAEIDAGFGMAGAHQHAAFLGDQRKDVARPHEIGGAAVAVGERAHRVAALLGRDAGGETVAHVDRDREGGAERRVVERHHGIEVQALGFLRRQRRADDAGGVADDERHLLGRAERRRDEQIALVLAVVVVGDDHDLALGEGGDNGFNADMDILMSFLHSFCPQPPGGSNGQAGLAPIWPR